MLHHLMTRYLAGFTQRLSKVVCADFSIFCYALHVVTLGSGYKAFFLAKTAAHVVPKCAGSELSMEASRVCAHDLAEHIFEST